MIDSRKTEIRYITDDPKKMLGKWVARRALKTWTEDFVDESSGKVICLSKKWLRDKQEERFMESLKHPERTFVKYKINSFIEESKIIPIGCFIPVDFSKVYNDSYDD